MTKASKLEIILPHIAHGPCCMVMFRIKILQNINFLDLTWISVCKNIAPWKRMSETWENSPEDSFIEILSCSLFQLVLTPRIKTWLFKLLERTNKDFWESETVRKKWLSEIAQLLLRRSKSASSEVSLRSERTKTEKMKSSTTTSRPSSDFPNGPLTLKHSSKNKTLWRWRKKQKCTLTLATWTQLP